MGVRYKTKVNKLPEIKKNLETLGGRSVEVGCLDGEHAWLAGIHEYGCVITPKNARYLTVPCSPRSIGRRAREFSDLWVLDAKSGEKFLCRDTGKNSFEILFWLARSVRIPERSFLRAGHDTNIQSVMADAEKMIGQIVSGSVSVETLLDLVGQELSTHIKTFARDLSGPANSPLTAEGKGSSNPLVDTGNMIEGISWRKK